MLQVEGVFFAQILPQFFCLYVFIKHSGWYFFFFSVDRHELLLSARTTSKGWRERERERGRGENALSHCKNLAFIRLNKIYKKVKIQQKINQ